MRVCIRALMACALFGTCPAQEPTPVKPPPAVPEATQPSKADVKFDRNAFTFLHYDLNVSIEPVSHGFTARGTVELQNDSDAPQRFVAMQISSSLRWATIKVNGKPVPFQSTRVESDIDHTGAVNEAIAELPQETAPSAKLTLEVGYQGTLSRDANRLKRLGMPAELAERSDWDGISAEFTAIRGVGYVTWYPVAIEPALLTDGKTVFDRIGQWEQRHSASGIQVQVTYPVEDPSAGMVAVSSGREAGDSRDDHGSATTERSTFIFPHLGVVAPVFAIGKFAVSSSATLRMAALGPGRAERYASILQTLEPLTPKKWIIQIIELPAGWTAFDAGSTFLTPFHAGASDKGLQDELIHTVQHANLYSPRAWIDEGVAHLAQLVLREQQEGRGAALETLKDRRGSLALAEAGLAGKQSLVNAYDETYYRTKAMFVWWMLRDLVGDDALKRALARYKPEEDKEPSYIQRLLEAEYKKSLEQFFDDWVYTDKGLPDLEVESAYVRELVTGGVVVTVTVANSGGAGAEVLVRVPVKDVEQSARLFVPGKGKATTRITVPLRPARVLLNDGSVPEQDMNNNEFMLEQKKTPQ